MATIATVNSISTSENADLDRDENVRGEFMICLRINFAAHVLGGRERECVWGWGGGLCERSILILHQDLSMFSI